MNGGVEERSGFTGRNRGLAIGVGLSPIWALAILSLTSSNCCHPMSEPTAPEALASQQVQMLLVAIAALLMVAGTIFLYRARSARAALIPLLLLTFPALFLVILGPAFVLILSN